MNYNYHDATLKTICADWIKRTVDVEFRLCEELSTPVRLTMTDVHNLCCPHRAPWGESASVNEVRVDAAAEVAKKIEIEMQSGDVIVVEGKEFVEELL